MPITQSEVATQDRMIRYPCFGYDLEVPRLSSLSFHVRAHEGESFVQLQEFLVVNVTRHTSLVVEFQFRMDLSTEDHKSLKIRQRWNYSSSCYVCRCHSEPLIRIEHRG